MRRLLLLIVTASAGISLACNAGTNTNSFAAGDASLPVGQPLPEDQVQQVNALLKTLPSADNTALDEMQAMTLAAYPLSCMDHLQAGGGGGGGGGAATMGTDAAPGAGVNPEADNAAGGGRGGRGGGRGRRGGSDNSGGNGAAAGAAAGGATGAGGESNATASGGGETGAGGNAASGEAPEAAAAPGRGRGGARGGAAAGAAAGGGGRGGYLYQSAGTAHLMENYDKHRVFYGCFDWHSAVNSTWTLVMVLKHYPGLPIDKLARARMDAHFAPANVQGELDFFHNSPNYERPYGQAWTLKLYNELFSWNDPDAQRWAANLKPLAQQFATGLAKYYDDLANPVRQGVHPNTSNTMKLMLPYTITTGDTTLHDSIERNARRLFLNDVDCPTGFEPEGSSFLSPCLSEAYLMSEMLDQPHFVAWFDAFMPEPYSHGFHPLLAPFDASMMQKPELLAAKSHLVGLAFSRAEAYLALAHALPSNDARVPVYLRLAAIHGLEGYKGMDAAGYLSSHWTASYAMMYEYQYDPNFRVTSKSAVASLEK